MKVVWRPEAFADLEAVVEFVARENAPAAVRLLLALRNAARSLSVLPQRGRPGRVAGTRELVALPTHIIVYEIARDEVRILRIWHARQDRA